MKKKIEFHVHTIASKDSMNMRLPIMLICKLKKINCLAITDHNEIKFALKNKEYFKKHNIDVIVGEEIFTSEGEIIGLFLSEKIEPNLTAKDTISAIKKQGGLVYIPHPYDLKREKTVIKEETLEKIKNDVDFIEKSNGRNIEKNFSIQQNLIAEKLNLRKIVGSDAHTLYELGRNYCLVDDYSKEYLKENIELATFVEKKCLKIAHFNTKVVKFIKLIGNGDINGIVRIVRRKITRRK